VRALRVSIARRSAHRRRYVTSALRRSLYSIYSNTTTSPLNHYLASGDSDATCGFWRQAVGDDDIYHSEDDGATWDKKGDAPDTLREAGRHPLDAGDLLLAEQDADSLHYTHNLGLSFDDVSDTVGTVNAIEVSRE